MADKVIKRDGMTIRHDFSVIFEGQPERKLLGTPMSKEDLRRAAELIKADPTKYSA